MSTLVVLGSALVWRLPVGGRELQELLRGLHTAGSLLRPMPDVELLLVRDAEIAACNARFMGCEGPTNILSFPADTDGAASHGTVAQPDELGNPASLMLSVDTVLREAFLYGESTRDCLLRLLAHGLGHVAGLDHGPEMDDFCANILQSQDKHFQAQKTA